MSAQYSRRPVVAGVDGSPAGDEPSGFAYEAAAARTVPLVAVHTRWGVAPDPAAAPRPDRQAARHRSVT